MLKKGAILFNKIHYTYKGCLFRASADSSNKNEQSIFHVEVMQKKGKNLQWIPVGGNDHQWRYFTSDEANQVANYLNSWAVYVGNDFEKDVGLA
jgi:hypothetical protein